MVARVRTCGLQGIGSYLVEVEADVSKGRSGFGIIGLGDSAVKEASERVQTAIVQSGLSVPKRTLINLAPAEFKKEGASFDLPIALAVLKASSQIRIDDYEDVAFFGELSLGGVIKPIRGIVALALEACAAGCTTVVVPAANYQEAAVIPGLVVVPVQSLSDAIHFLHTAEIRAACEESHRSTKQKSVRCLDEVVGQDRAKRAFEIAAAGGHNLLMVGPPGCGKSMLAERFVSLLPPLSEAEIAESVQIHSVAGLPVHHLLQGVRPFRAPHHGVSEAGLIGGGSNPRPGEISLSHRGVLFLDELPEFRRAALESLRAPLEAGKVTIARAKGSVNFPARFQLLAAMNPCPCGRTGVQNLQCLCSQQEIARYIRKLSQPLLDRFDIQMELDAVPVSELGQAKFRSKSSGAYERVEKARSIAVKRQSRLNSQLESKAFTEFPCFNMQAIEFIKKIADKGLLSARGYYRVLRVSRTIADLIASEEVLAEHIAEAVQFRTLDRLQGAIGA